MMKFKTLRESAKFYYTHRGYNEDGIIMNYLINKYKGDEDKALEHFDKACKSFDTYLTNFKKREFMKRIGSVKNANREIYQSRNKRKDMR